MQCGYAAHEKAPNHEHIRPAGPAACACLSRALFGNRWGRRNEARNTEESPDRSRAFLSP